MSVVQTKPAPLSATAKPAPHHRDAFREVCETIAFVVALVLMLKLFVVEAFVIPTGSMAETLYGHQKIVTCPDCGYEYPVNSSNEVVPWDGQPRRVIGTCCPNCRHRHALSPENSPANRSGDRVLVHKGTYHVTGGPARGDVVVFKFPVDPQVNHEAQNYIKRLWGLGGETLGIWRGDLYVTRGLNYPADELDSFGHKKYPRPEDDPLRLWEGPDVDRHSKTRPHYRSLGLDFTYHNADLALKAFDAARLAGFPASGFELVRKSDDEALAMRRIVYDNDHPSKRLAKAGVPPRWGPAGPNWSADSAQTPKAFTHTGGELTFLRYAHRVSAPPTDLRADGQVEPFGQSRYIDDWDKVAKGAPAAGLFPPSPITNFLGYNAGAEASPGGGVEVRQTGQYWVGDLMLECAAKVSGPQDAVVLELSRGVNRFQAKFADGKLALVRVGPGGKELASVPSPITGAGEYALRFANFDRRLRVWVNDRPVDLGPAADYSPDGATGFEAAVGALTGGAFVPRPDGHTLENDILAPASVGASGTVTVSKVKLWNDTFFTPAENARPTLDPDDPVDTFYVQPGHYLVLGDNSGQSSDSRKWGLVPDRLMLGKAIFVFFPLNRIGFIE